MTLGRSVAVYTMGEFLLVFEHSHFSAVAAISLPA